MSATGLEQEANHHTGGSGVGNLESLLRAALLNEQGTIPRLFKRGANVREHLRKVDEYVKARGFDSKGKCAWLVNSLEENILMEYATKSEDYSWLTKKVEDMLSDRTSMSHHW